jgi:hexose oxidase
MNRRRFIRQTTGGSIASLLALTGKAPSAALADLSAASGNDVLSGADFLVFNPDSPSFQSLTQGFNGRWSAPNARQIYLPLTEAGVESATQQIFEAGYGRHFKVRGGAHCYEDFVFNAGVEAILDLSLLNGVGFDSDRGVFYAQGGANNFDLQHSLIRFGKTLPAGSCPTVGLGGHICGGGYGVLSPLYGLTVDWLTGVSLVHLRHGHPEGIHVTRDSTATEADLFWAHTGGGGGNFGVITRYEFADLPDAPVSADVQIYAWNWSLVKRRGPGFLNRIVRFFEFLSDTLGPQAFVILKLTHFDSGQIQLLVQNVHLSGQVTAHDLGLRDGFKQRLEKALASHGLVETASAIKSVAGHPSPFKPKSSQHFTWWEAFTFYGASGGPMNGKYKSAYMRQSFTDEDIRTIYRHLTRKMRDEGGHPVSMRDSLLQVDSYGGRINSVVREATAVWQRDSIYKLQYQTYWPIDRTREGIHATGDLNLKWIRDFYADMYSATNGIPDPAMDATGQLDGCYINYPDVDLNHFGLQKALQLYYGRHLDRLMRAKTAWDPLNFFNHAQSIPLIESGVSRVAAP